MLKEGDLRESKCFPTREEAENVRSELLREAARRIGLTVGSLVELYRGYLENQRGIKPDSAAHVVAGVLALLPEEASISSLTTEKIRSYYSALTQRPNQRTGKPLSVTTHQVWLQYAKSLGKWAVKAKHLASDPFSGVEPIGKRSVGKVQLTVSEAQKLDALALARARKGDSRSLGVLLMLHLGLRKGEVGARRVRDVDQEGRVLWIQSGKTKNAARRLIVPEVLRPLLVVQTEGKQPGDLLFQTLTGNAPHKMYFWLHLRELCAEAGVPIVCPHSLRGLHATLALEAGATSENVARALGHGSFAMTQKHYATPESVLSNRQQRVSSELGSDVRSRIESLLASLSPQETAELKRQLAAR